MGQMKEAFEIRAILYQRTHEKITLNLKTNLVYYTILAESLASLGSACDLIW